MDKFKAIDNLGKKMQKAGATMTIGTILFLIGIFTMPLGIILIIFGGLIMIGGFGMLFEK